MYQVIARKYRPQNFTELIGQEHVQKTLANAITSNRVAHGYIFSGQRGTGKTTVARIMAKCLNCEHGPTPTPCGVCSSCREITVGASPNVIEIDAASNRGINEMREIRQNVDLQPLGRERFKHVRKVVIIDEAHQVTKDAFNALLKTLEEPPEWVVFILCTTEAYEIPNTIASRCQHFTFRSVDFAELMERMRYIVEQEGIDADDEVLSVIAQAGEGSVRDSLSALDQAIACCGTKLDVNNIRSLLGVFGTDSLRAVAEAVDQQDGNRMLEIVEELERSGQSLQHFCRELARYWRNLLVAKISGKPTRLIAAAESEQKDFLNTAESFSEEDLTRYLNLTLELYKTMQTSLQPRLHLELGLVKLVHAGKLQPIEEALAGLGGQEKPVVLSASTKTPAPRPPAFQAPAPPLKASAEKPPAEESPAPTGDFRQDFYQALSKAGMEHSADAVQHCEVRLSGNEVVIRAPKSMLLLLKDPGVERVAAQVAGKPVRVKLEAGENLTATAIEPAEKTASAENEIRQRALSHPGVKRFQELFPGAQVRTVRNLNE